jgi:hypothetical protein
MNVRLWPTVAGRWLRASGEISSDLALHSGEKSLVELLERQSGGASAPACLTGI